MSSTVRSILMRALIDPDFHGLLVHAPDRALQGYKLTDAETNALLHPGADFYKLLQPGTDVVVPTLEPDGGTPPPPPPTTVTVIIVVAITVFVTAVATYKQLPNFSRYSTLIEAIHNSTGAQRADLVKTLINELTKDQ